MKNTVEVKSNVVKYVTHNLVAKPFNCDFKSSDSIYRIRKNGGYYGSSESMPVEIKEIEILIDLLQNIKELSGQQD